MQFNVSSLLKERTGATREYDIDDVVMVDGAGRRLVGHARMDRTPDGILVRARMTGQDEAECSRCLRHLTFPVIVEVEEEWIPTVDVDTGARVEPREGEEEAYRITARHILDLGEAGRQYWTMARPMAPVCEENCGGICAVCGREHAEAGHECVAGEIDDRWTKLRELKLRTGS